MEKEVFETKEITEKEKKKELIQKMRKLPPPKGEWIPLNSLPDSVYRNIYYDS